MHNKGALISLILGILAFIPILGFILAPPAIIFGIFGTRMNIGRAMAISGIVLVFVAIIFNILFFIFVIIPLFIAAALAATCSAIGQSCSQSGA